MRSSILALSLLLAGAAPLAAQTLNPVVTVLPRPTSVVPAECAEGLAPAPAPRVTPEEVQAAAPKPPRPAVMQPPPSTSLRGGLREIQDAAERGDRDAFRDALARVHALVDSYPPGGEKNAASDVLKVYDDLQAIWDYQFQSPTGAFFDASTDNLLARMKSYPEYQRVIAGQTIVDATGTRFYPTRETHDFLVREAASRLKRLGVSTSASKPPTVERPATSGAKPAPPRTVERPATSGAKPAPPRTVERPATSPGERRASAAGKPATHAGSRPKPVTRPRVSAPPKAAKAVRPSSSKPAPKTTPAPPKIAEAAAPPMSKPVAKTAPPITTPSPVSKPSPEPVAPTTPTTTTATPPPPPPATTSTMAPVTTREAAPAEPQAPAAKKSGWHRYLLLPLILIVLGVAVLIVLFRTKS